MLVALGTTRWVNGYRYSSSGPAAKNRTSISNIIPIEKGDTVKNSGVTLREGTDRVVINTSQTSGNVVDAMGYFNDGIPVVGFEYQGYEDGVYTFYLTDSYEGGNKPLQICNVYTYRF